MEDRHRAEDIAIQELSARNLDTEIATAHSWITVDHVLNAFLRHSKENHEPATTEWYEWFFSTFQPKFGRIQITQLRKHHIDAWVKSRKFGPTTVNRGIGAIKRAFAWAVEDGSSSRSRLPQVHRPQLP